MKEDYEYRDCKIIIDALNNGNHDEELEFFRMITEDTDLFFGIRHNKLQLYKSRAMVVEVSYKKKEDRLVYKINTTEDLNNKNESKEVTFKEFKEQFARIVQNSKNKYRDRGLFEEICQQWIVDMNNKHSDDYYYVDMEFNIQGTRLGRIDMIAISKRKIDGKHKVVLIELKVGKQSISGTWSKDERYEENIEENIFNGDLKHPLKFGSGIVGHIVDYYRIISEENYSIVKESICRMLKCQKELGYLKESNLGELQADELSDKPEVIIACYTHAPKTSYDVTEENQNPKTPIKELMREVHKNLYNTIGSEFNLQDALPSNLTNGFMSRSIDNYEEMDETMCYSQEIHGETYCFIIKFIDADSVDCWKLI